MLDWPVVAVVVLYLFGMLATRNTIKALKNDLFGDGSVGHVVIGLLAVVLWPLAQIIATSVVRGPDKPY